MFYHLKETFLPQLFDLERGKWYDNDTLWYNRHGAVFNCVKICLITLIYSYQ